MKELKITDTAALQAFNGTDTKGKKLLTDLFGKEVFNQKITDRVKTFDDVCSILGKRLSELVPSGTSKALQAFAKLMAIVEVLNEGWTPDWNNDDQAKYWPWFDMSDGFSLNLYDRICQDSNVGSRLCFKSRELALYAGEQFLEIYKDAFVL